MLIKIKITILMQSSWHICIIRSPVCLAFIKNNIICYALHVLVRTCTLPFLLLTVDINLHFFSSESKNMTAFFQNNCTCSWIKTNLHFRKFMGFFPCYILIRWLGINRTIYLTSPSSIYNNKQHSQSEENRKHIFSVHDKNTQSTYILYVK